MRAQMAHFQAKIGVFGTLDHQKLIYLTSSVYFDSTYKELSLSANLPFKNFVLPLFDPKIGPKK